MPQMLGIFAVTGEHLFMVRSILYCSFGYVTWAWGTRARLPSIAPGRGRPTLRPPRRLLSSPNPKGPQSPGRESGSTRTDQGLPPPVRHPPYLICRSSRASDLRPPPRAESAPDPRTPPPTTTPTLC
ncbi:hypothetical protein CEXT_331541 [Caerostris extrusa]|uniref:Uncharacterized protein n=1 Tax=Caerostris extrusa TaxID=172846 RepID=A0AAV4NQ94_CAEEX|nr:hypothetical protein CEXT_331541 [Caerostris extrusa]